MLRLGLRQLRCHLKKVPHGRLPIVLEQAYERSTLRIEEGI